MSSYSFTIGFSICTAAFIYSPLVPPEWNGLFLPPNVTVASVMACRLFRELKLGIVKDGTTEVSVISKMMFKGGRDNVQRSEIAFEMRDLSDPGTGSGFTDSLRYAHDGAV